jgi:hypothetical protein
MALTEAVDGSRMGGDLTQMLMELTATPGRMLMQVLNDHLLTIGRESIVRALGTPRLIAQRLADSLERSCPEFIEITAGHAEAIGHLMTGLTAQHRENGFEAMLPHGQKGGEGHGCHVHHVSIYTGWLHHHDRLLSTASRGMMPSV